MFASALLVNLPWLRSRPASTCPSWSILLIVNRLQAARRFAWQTFCQRPCFVGRGDIDFSNRANTMPTMLRTGEVERESSRHHRGGDRLRSCGPPSSTLFPTLMRSVVAGPLLRGLGDDAEHDGSGAVDVPHRQSPWRSGSAERSWSRRGFTTGGGEAERGRHRPCLMQARLLQRGGRGSAVDLSPSSTWSSAARRSSPRHPATTLAGPALADTVSREPRDAVGGEPARRSRGVGEGAEPRADARTALDACEIGSRMRNP